jgi:hypothetical protein
MKTVKLSFSVLNGWASGRFEDAIASYLGKPYPTTPYMELGKLMHERWATYILETKRMPPELGNQKLKNPIVEQKYEKIIPMGDNYQILLRGVIDLECEEPIGKIVQDHKCGVGRCAGYVDSMQLDYYKLLRPDVTLGRYACHNPYKCEAYCQKKKLKKHECFGYGIKFLTDQNAENALNHIQTYGGEMIQYLEANKLLIDYKG